MTPLPDAPGRWDVLFSAAALKQLVCAALFGRLGRAAPLAGSGRRTRREAAA